MHDSNCVFCKIISGALPSDMVYQDDEVVAVRDINPAAPVHLLVLPRRHIPSLQEAQPADQALLGKMMLLVAQLAAEHACDDGFRTVVNTGRNGGQEVYHLHIHLLGGPRPWKRVFA